MHPLCLRGLHWGPILCVSGALLATICSFLPLHGFPPWFLAPFLTFFSLSFFHLFLRYHSVLWCVIAAGASEALQPSFPAILHIPYVHTQVHNPYSPAFFVHFSLLSLPLLPVFFPLLTSPLCLMCFDICVIPVQCFLSGLRWDAGNFEGSSE